MFANGPGVIYQSVKSNAIIWKYRSVLHGLTKTRKKRHTPWITSEKNLHSPWKTLFEYEPRDWKHDQRIHISVGYSVFSLSTVQLRVLFSVLSILIRSWVTWLYRRTEQQQQNVLLRDCLANSKTSIPNADWNVVSDGDKSLSSSFNSLWKAFRTLYVRKFIANYHLLSICLSMDYGFMSTISFHFAPFIRIV